MRSSRWVALVVGIASGMLGVYACSSGAAQGTVGGACYPNGTCNGTLTCLSNLCVQENTDGGDATVDGPGTDTGGDSAADASSDAAESGVTDKDCQQLDASGACSNCCATIHDGGTVFGQAYYACSCEGGACNGVCQNNWCLSQNPSTQCANCLTNTCAPTAQAACNLNVSCVAWSNCNTGCPQ